MIKALMLGAEPDLLKTAQVVIVSFDRNTGSHTVTYRGATVGPVWSQNGVKHPVGATVKALVKNGTIEALLP